MCQFCVYDGVGGGRDWIGILGCCKMDTFYQTDTFGFLKFVIKFYKM